MIVGNRVRGIFLVAVDGGPEGSGLDSFTVINRLDFLGLPNVPPTDCTVSGLPATGDPVTQGDIVVIDAEPFPTSKGQCKNGGWTQLRCLQEPGRLRQLRSDRRQEPAEDRLALRRVLFQQAERRQCVFVAEVRLAQQKPCHPAPIVTSAQRRPDAARPQKTNSTPRATTPKPPSSGRMVVPRAPNAEVGRKAARIHRRRPSCCRCTSRPRLRPGDRGRTERISSWPGSTASRASIQCRDRLTSRRPSAESRSSGAVGRIHRARARVIPRRRYREPQGIASKKHPPRDTGHRRRRDHGGGDVAGERGDGAASVRGLQRAVIVEASLGLCATDVELRRSTCRASRGAPCPRATSEFGGGFDDASTSAGRSCRIDVAGDSWTRGDRVVVLGREYRRGWRGERARDRTRDVRLSSSGTGKIVRIAGLHRTTPRPSKPWGWRSSPLTVTPAPTPSRPLCGVQSKLGAATEVCG